MSFELHPQLAKDTTVIGHFPLCVALLSKDNAVPWVILVPKRANLKELHHLPMKEATTVFARISSRQPSA